MLIDYKDCAALISVLHGALPRNVLHVGAHLGEEARAYAESGVQKVIWFEANPDIVPGLLANLDSEPSTEHQVFPYALWSENKIMSFNVTNNFQSSSFLDLKKHGDYYPWIQVTGVKDIQAYSFDFIIDTQAEKLSFLDPNFINIDTQGAELHILKGMVSVLKSRSLKGIFLEINFEELYSGVPLVQDIDGFLLDFGFVRVATSTTSHGWGDALYLRRLETCAE